MLYISSKWQDLAGFGGKMWYFNAEQASLFQTSYPQTQLSKSQFRFTFSKSNITMRVRCIGAYCICRQNYRIWKTILRLSKLNSGLFFQNIIAECIYAICFTIFSIKQVSISVKFAMMILPFYICNSIAASLALSSAFRSLAILYSSVCEAFIFASRIRIFSCNFL